MAAVSWPLKEFDRWATIWIQNQDVVLSTYSTCSMYCIQAKFEQIN